MVLEQTENLLRGRIEFSISMHTHSELDKIFIFNIKKALPIIDAIRRGEQTKDDVSFITNKIGSHIDQMIERSKGDIESCDRVGNNEMAERCRGTLLNLNDCALEILLLKKSTI